MNRIPIFDTVQKMVGGDLTTQQASDLNEACDLSEGAIAATAPPAHYPSSPPPGHRAIDDKGMALIKRFEGCALAAGGGYFTAYPDPGSADGNPWTIGWGATGPNIAKGTRWSQKECDDRFAVDMQHYADAVSHAIGTAPTTQNQFDALVSFHYNTGAIATATLTKLHIKGDYKGAEAEFGKWTRNAGKVMAGLVKRRAAEAALYAAP